MYSSQFEKAALPIVSLHCEHGLFWKIEDKVPLTAHVIQSYFECCTLQACLYESLWLLWQYKDPATNRSSVFVLSSHTVLQSNLIRQILFFNTDTPHLQTINRKSKNLKRDLFGFQRLCAVYSLLLRYFPLFITAGKKRRLNFPFAVPAVTFVRQQLTNHLLWYPLCKQ